MLCKCNFLLICLACQLSAETYRVFSGASDYSRIFSLPKEAQIVHSFARFRDLTKLFVSGRKMSYLFVLTCQPLAIGFLMIKTSFFNAYFDGDFNIYGRVLRAEFAKFHVTYLLLPLDDEQTTVNKTGTSTFFRCFFLHCTCIKNIKNCVYSNLSDCKFCNFVNARE